MKPTLAAMMMRLGASVRTRRRERQRLSTLPRIGGMASIPTRADDLEQVLARIVPQVERLYLFLHGYDAIPAAARHPRIVPVVAPVDTPLRASGKFYGLLQQTGPCLYFCFDDDILYPPDYVARMTAAIRRYGGRAFVGVHCTSYPGSRTSYTRDRPRPHHGRPRSRALSRLWRSATTLCTARLRPRWQWRHPAAPTGRPGRLGAHRRRSAALADQAPVAAPG